MEKKILKYTPLCFLLIATLSSSLAWERHRHHTKTRVEHTRLQQGGTQNLLPTKGLTTSPLLDVKVPAHVSNLRINHTAMVVYFNRDYRIPNCVIYDFTATEAVQCDAPGAERRKHYRFEPDPATGASPQWSDYRRSGYDRGHMAPAMDMKWNRTVMTEAFYMTNICPQNHNLNGGVWRVMEEKIHRWAKRDKRLIIATGPILGHDMKMIGPKHNIAVPKAFYKVVYAPGQGRAIAFVYNNETDTGRGSLRSHAVSVDYVERSTGLDFFSALPLKVQASFEKHSNYDQWEPKKR